MEEVSSHVYYNKAAGFSETLVTLFQITKYTYLRQLKSKAVIPLQPWTSSELSSRLRLSDYKTIGT
jgi:hypothetical protein